MPNRMFGQLKPTRMARPLLITMCTLTVAAFSIANAYNGNDAYRLSQPVYIWGRSRSVVENQAAPVRPYAPPVPATPPTPAPQQGNNRFSDIARRLQIQDRNGVLGGRYPPSVPATITYNSGYQGQYNPSRGYPSQVYNPGQSVPSYNPAIAAPVQQGNPGYYPTFTNPRPNPRIPSWQRFNAGVEPRAPNTDYSIYPDFRRHIPPVPATPPRINPDRPNMRPAPKDDGISDRDRDTQNNFYNQWASDLIGGPSFWDRTADRRGQPPQQRTTTTPPPPTEATTTTPRPRVDPNFFKPDGSVNTHRLGMIKPPVNEDTIRDREAGNTAYDIIMSLLGRNFFRESADRSRGKSSEPEDAPPRPQQAPQAMEAPTTTPSHPPMFDKPYKDVPHDFFDIGYKQNREKNDTVADPTSSQSQRSGNSKNDNSGNSEKYFTSDGKMYQSEVYSDYLTAANTKLSSVNGQKAHEDDTNREGGNRRTRRQAGGNNALVSDGISCRTPSAFPRCQFYPRCFQTLNQECVSRESFIGDDVSSICSDLHALANSTESQVLRTFLSEVIACVDESLLEVLESPSCDDVTDHLSNVLLSRGTRSCLAKASNFCELLETPVARYNLARVFAEPRGRENFMLRLLVSLGTHTNTCKGPGVNIFLLDLLSNVMHRDSTYTMPNGQRLPVFEP